MSAATCGAMAGTANRRTEPQAVFRNRDSAQLDDAVDSDEALRQRRLPRARADDEIGAAGDRSCPGGEGRQRLVDRAGGDVRGDAHDPAPHTRSGVIGSARTRGSTKDAFVDYCSQGKRSYFIASRFDDEPFQEEAPVLRRLSEQFELCAYGLSQVRKEWEQVRVK